MGNKKVVSLISAIIVSLGIFGAGYSIGKGFYLVKKMSRTVTVKGLAQQDVRADLGIWEINYRELGNDLIKLDAQLQQDETNVVNFLKAQGFTDEEIGRSQLKVEDRLANTYNNNSDNANAQRYVVTGGVVVRSQKVELIRQTTSMTDKLLQQGVPVAFDISSMSPNPSYFYTKLDSIRPSMLAEATKSARSVAEQFAKDSGSTLGGMQHASQGQFQIMARDTDSSNADGYIDKKIRLVTTIDYQLR